MTPGPPVGEAALAQLVALVREETGNVVPHARFSFLEEIASRRARARGFVDGAAYVAALARGELEGEWDQLIPLITVKESYFFRAPQQFAAIERHVLPRVLAARASQRTLRIWSAAAARGEEPATLALILAEHEALASWDWRVVATDLDADALAAAERGLYGDRAVAQVPERLREKWFTRRGSLYELDPAIRSRIELRQVNLSRPPYRELPAEPFDLVLLRNVLIYFRRALQRRVVSEVVRRLAPEGYLFLGASETLWQIFDQLGAVDLGECFGYRHPAAEEPPRRRAPVRFRIEPKVEPPAPEPAEPERPPEPPERAEAVLPPGPRRPRAAAISPEAAPTLDEPMVADEVPPEPEPPRPSRDGGSAQDLLVRASRELAENRVEAAQRLVGEAREADPSEPAVYALEGFLHDLANRTEEAVAAYRAALYLDPGLYQPRLLLADCLARLGHRARAEHEFRQVLADLDRGGARELVLLEELPLPGRTRALRQCRRALGRR